jgi:hypothetical protein
MVKHAWIWVLTGLLAIGVGESTGFAQFGGRGMGGFFGGTSRGGRGNMQNRGNSVPRLTPDSYEQTEHGLAVMEMDLRLTPEQKEAWQSFADKVRVYASDLSREHARADLPVSEGTAVGGLQHIDLVTDGARIRVKELEDIRTAANGLYATLSPDQQKTADARISALITPSGVPTGGPGNRNFSGLGSTNRPQP